MYKPIPNEHVSDPRSTAANNERIDGAYHAKSHRSHVDRGRRFDRWHFHVHVLPICRHHIPSDRCNFIDDFTRKVRHRCQQ